MLHRSTTSIERPCQYSLTKIMFKAFPRIIRQQYRGSEFVHIVQIIVLYRQSYGCEYVWLGCQGDFRGILFKNSINHRFCRR